MNEPDQTDPNLVSRTAAASITARLLSEARVPKETAADLIEQLALWLLEGAVSSAHILASLQDHQAIEINRVIKQLREQASHHRHKATQLYGVADCLVDEVRRRAEWLEQKGET
jgi:hypothetical protein